MLSFVTLRLSNLNGKLTNRTEYMIPIIDLRFTALARIFILFHVYTGLNSEKEMFRNNKNGLAVCEYQRLLITARSHLCKISPSWGVPTAASTFIILSSLIRFGLVWLLVYVTKNNRQDWLFGVTRDGKNTQRHVGECCSKLIYRVEYYLCLRSLVYVAIFEKMYFCILGFREK